MLNLEGKIMFRTATQLRKINYLFASALGLSIALIVPLVAQSRQGNIEAKKDGSIVWQAGINGVEIEFDANGKVQRIFSKYAQPVTIADQRGIRTASMIAEEKAKAEIIRFLNQEISTGRAVAEIEATASRALQEDKSSAKTLQKIDERNISQSLTEITSSTATGKLRGVVVLENGFDSKLNEAWVVVGLSNKTVNASQSVKDFIDPDATSSDVELQTNQENS